MVALLRSRLRISAVLVGVLLILASMTPALAEDTVRIGFLYGSTWQKMSRAGEPAAMEVWSEELGSKFQIPVKVSFYGDMDTMHQDFLQLKINAVSADSLSMARTFKPDELAEGFSAGVPGGWDLQMLASRDSTLKGVADLAGKRVVLVQGDPPSELVLEHLCLQHYKRECQKVFSEIQHVPTSNQATMRLYFGKADVAMVYRSAFELSREMNPQLEQKVGRVITEQPLTGVFYAFFNPSVEPEFRKRALRMVPVLHTYPRGRQILDLFKMDHLELAEPSELLPFIKLDKEVHELKGQVTAQNGHGGRK